MADIAPTIPPPSQVIEFVGAYNTMRRVRATDATITMVPLPELEQFRDRLAAANNALKTATDALQQEALELRLPIAGAVIAGNDAPPPPVAQVVASGREARDEVATTAQAVTEIKSRAHQGLSGLVHRVGDHLELEKAEARLKAAESELSNARTALAGAMPAELESRADPSVRERLSWLERSIAKNQAELKQGGDLLQALNTEIADRHHEADAFHFDRLLLMASLHSDGPQVVDAPVVLKAREHAHVSVPARLARHKTRRRYVGSTQGVSIPVYKGIRYRVGGFSGQPITEDVIAVVDTGTFVLTDQRIVFVGSAKLVQMPLSKVIHVGTYSDALEIGREGKESMDIFMLDSPQYVLCFLNYLLAMVANQAKD